jgi:2'-hydroxyisoflavone reductase
MRVFIIGGTRFVGRALTQAALDAGHDVTLFNRGQTNPDLFPQVEHLQGDRDGGLDALEGRTWDAAIDTCGYVPRLVRDATEQLKDAVEHYTFISTISVYDGSVYTSTGATEDAPLATLEDETTEEVTGETYGGLKVLCEQAAEVVMPGRVLHARPGLIIGPHDPTDRFTYWPVQVARGGQVLAPPEDAPLQVIDVRDLAKWLIAMIEARKTGAYNATGPAYPLTFDKVLIDCREAAGEDSAEVHHASSEFLLQHEAQPMGSLPLWLPESHAGMFRVSVEKALADGLVLRPLPQTIQDTLSWFKDERGLDEELRAGINDERKDELLKAIPDKR